MKRKITVIIDDGEDEQSPDITAFPDYDRDENNLVVKPGSYYWERQKRQIGEDSNGWVDGVDICATCPNRPGGPNNKSGICYCVVPSMYGPNRITC